MRTALSAATLFLVLSAIGCHSAPPPAAPAPAPKPIPQSMPAAFFGDWTAQSPQAAETTGDVSLTGTSITIAGKKPLGLTGAKGLPPADALAINSQQLVFGSPADSFIAGVDIPHKLKFAQGNTLCDKQDIKWVAGISRNDTIGLVFFAGDNAPTITAAGMTSDPNVCGSYSYSRKRP